jgi:hypothetical protein
VALILGLSIGEVKGAVRKKEKGLGGRPRLWGLMAAEIPRGFLGSTHEAFCCGRQKGAMEVTDSWKDPAGARQDVPMTEDIRVFRHIQDSEVRLGGAAFASDFDLC